MRYLIKHKKEFAITVAAFIMAVINLIRAIRSKEVTEELIIAVLVTSTSILAWYYNMPTSEENHDHTGQMRLEKKKDDLPENYWDDVDEGEPEDPFAEGGDTDGEC